MTTLDIHFSVVQRKAVSPTDLTQVGDRIRDFEDRCNATAQPFRWKVTTSGAELPPPLVAQVGTGRGGGAGQDGCVGDSPKVFQMSLKISICAPIEFRRSARSS
ncbi:hypothetical protein R6L23_02630 [Streptomyces sp. SR27]|uniref:hypothetical protein n=1 Tax=Streptomyces sp. SR27 TaxID=3076630 RepID=UPI00295A9B80|nr:hypothetical protein [Streptomyces sp. SR27]MDV9187122.1 hypothetical protein [Streptomyces sp. SR27]